MQLSQIKLHPEKHIHFVISLSVCCEALENKLLNRMQCTISRHVINLVPCKTISLKEINTEVMVQFAANKLESLFRPNTYRWKF